LSFPSVLLHFVPLCFILFHFFILFGEIQTNERSIKLFVFFSLRVVRSVSLCYFAEIYNSTLVL